MRTNRSQTKITGGLQTICKSSAALLFAVTLTAGITGCSDDNDFVSDEVPDKELSHPLEIISYDDLSVFQNTIAETDEQGNIINHLYGEPLETDDPEHLFIGVENLKEAKDMFDLWFANDVGIRPSSNGGVSVSLTDCEGYPQGTIYFHPGTEENHVAEVTASPDTQLKGFRQITFLKNSAWPKKNLLQAGKKYYKFDIVKNIKMAEIQDCLYDDDKSLNFVCIQGSSNGVKPIFCAISGSRLRGVCQRDVQV